MVISGGGNCPITGFGVVRAARLGRRRQLSRVGWSQSAAALVDNPIHTDPQTTHSLLRAAVDRLHDCDYDTPGRAVSAGAVCSTASGDSLKHRRTWVTFSSPNPAQTHCEVKKVNVAHTRLPSVGFRSWSRFLAVSLQVTWVINPAVGCHYFPPGPQLPSQPWRGLLSISLFGEQRHDGCEGVNSLPKTVTRQRRGCDLSPGPFMPEFSTLTTRLPSHPREV